MRSWYLLMAIFVTILAIMVFILGSIEHPDRTAAAGLTGKTGFRLDSPENAPCPWQLESITIRGSHDHETVDNDLQQEEHVSFEDYRGMNKRDNRG